MNLLQTTWRMADGQPHLIGSRCGRCASVQFPARIVCPHCGPGTPMTETRLSTQGRLYAFTQLHQSKPNFPTPYYMGYVDLPERVRVPARIVCNGSEPPPLQAAVRIDTDVVAMSSAGEPVISYVFRPIEGPSATAQP